MIFSDAVFNLFRESLPDLSTEKDFFRWAQRLVEKTPFGVEDGKTLLLRAHKEALNLKFNDQEHEDMIFLCLHRMWTNIERGKALHTKEEFPRALVSSSGKIIDIDEAWREAWETLKGNTENKMPLDNKPQKEMTLTKPSRPSPKSVYTQRKKIKKIFLNDIDPKAILRRRYRRQYRRVCHVKW